MPTGSRGPRLIAIEGPSGSGKSSLVAAAVAALGWVPLAEAYDRIDPRPDLRVPTPSALARTERTLLAEEGRRWRAARALRDRGATVIADTGFLGPLTYTRGLVALGRAPERLLGELVGRARAMAERGEWGLPEAIVYLTTRPATRRGRASRDPARHPARLRERHEEVGAVEQQFYRQLGRWYPARVRFLRAEEPAPLLAARLPACLRRVPPAGWGPAAALRVLVGLAPPAAGTGAVAGRRRPATVKKSALPPRGPSR